MANSFLTMTQLETLLHSAVTQMLGYTVQANPDKVRISWPTDGAPAWKITDDVTFLRIVPASDNYSKLRNTSYVDAGITSVTKSTNQTRIFDVNLICYGPNSFENIETIRNSVYEELYRNMLSASNVYVMPDISMPTRSPELYNGRWWERSNLTIRIYEGTLRDSAVNLIDSAEIIVTKVNK
jgi:hypothetical protein